MSARAPSPNALSTPPASMKAMTSPSVRRVAEDRAERRDEGRVGRREDGVLVVCARQGAGQAGLDDGRLEDVELAVGGEDDVDDRGGAGLGAGVRGEDGGRSHQEGEGRDGGAAEDGSHGALLGEGSAGPREGCGPAGMETKGAQLAVVEPLDIAHRPSTGSRATPARPTRM